MNVMDNSPVDVPAVGKLVSEELALGHFTDCCLYVLPSNANIFAEKGKELFDGFMASMGKNQLLNKYDFEVLEKLPIMDNHPTLRNAIIEEQCQFLMPLYTPSRPDKQYLLLHTKEEEIYRDIASMINSSEQISKHSINELLKNYAISSPEGFCNNVKETVKSEKFWKDYITSVVSGLFQPRYAMAARLPRIKDVLKIDGIITHRKKGEMLDRMVENIYKYRRKKDKKAEAELDYVLNSLDIESLKSVLTKLSKKQLDMFNKTVNPKILAQESTMSLVVKYEGKIDLHNSNDGLYRLFLRKNYVQEQVHFGRKEAFILYLIYIIDKHEHDNVNSLNIKKYKKRFTRLFKEVYNLDEGESRFEKLFTHVDKEGNIQPAQIKHCYMYIRMALSDGCEKLRELPAPFILTDANDHLYVLKDKISVPQNLIDLMKEE